MPPTFGKIFSRSVTTNLSVSDTAANLRHAGQWVTCVMENKLMRIHYHSMQHPKAAAKRFKAEFMSWPLMRCQDITALLLGYHDWHDLSTETKHKHASPSLLDEKISTSDQQKRVAYQVQQLQKVSPLVPACIEDVVLRVRPSAGNIKHSALYANPYHHHRIAKDENNWRIFFSKKTLESREEIDALLEGYPNARYQTGLKKILQNDPTNLCAGQWLIEDYLDAENFKQAIAVGQPIIAALEAALPAETKTLKRMPLNWFTHDNRPLYRCYLFMARAYHGDKQFTAAIPLFRQLQRFDPASYDDTQAEIEACLNQAPLQR